MVWSGLQLLSKTHQSGMSKVREEGIPGTVWPGLGGPALEMDPPGWAAAPLCWRPIGWCISVSHCSYPAQTHQRSLRLWRFMQHNRKGWSCYFIVDGQQDNSDQNGKKWFYLKLSTLAIHVIRMWMLPNFSLLLCCLDTLHMVLCFKRPPSIFMEVFTGSLFLRG